MSLPDFSNYELTEQDAEDFFKYFNEQAEREVVAVKKADKLHQALKNLDSLDNYLEKLSKLESKLDYGQELPEYWTLIRVAENYGKLLDLSPEISHEINTFISAFYHYKDYIFGTMNGQGSCAWFVKYKDYEYLLGPEQLSFNF